MKNIVDYIKEQYGEKAIPHERTEPFKSNDLMVKELPNGVSVRDFSPSTPGGYFVVEYHETTKAYRLDVDFESGTVSVKEKEHFTEVAKYRFSRETSTFSFAFVSGKNFFFEETRNAIKTYFDLKEGFKWIEK